MELSDRLCRIPNVETDQREAPRTADEHSPLLSIFSPAVRSPRRCRHTSHKHAPSRMRCVTLQVLMDQDLFAHREPMLLKYQNSNLATKQVL